MCAVGGWGPMFGTKSQINPFFWHLPLPGQHHGLPFSSLSCRVALIVRLPPRLTTFWITSSQILDSISSQPGWQAGTIKATLLSCLQAIFCLIWDQWSPFCRNLLILEAVAQSGFGQMEEFPFPLFYPFFLIRVVVTRSHYCGQMEVFVVASAKRSCTHLSCSQDSLLREIFFDLPRTTWICKQSLVSTSSNLPRGDLTLSIIRIDDSLSRLWLIEKV